MNWFDWVLLVYFLLGIIATISLVGKERKPIGSDTAIATLILSGLMIAGVIYA